MPSIFWLALTFLLLMLGFFVMDVLHVIIALLDKDHPVE